MQDRAIKESWEVFGRRIRHFIDKHGSDLADFDFVVGFTRGGMILASILCTLLGDELSSSGQGNKHPVALRPLPAGLSVKSNRDQDPCFAMASPMSKEEESDAVNLVEDIEKFRASFSHYSERKINLLLVDDNLTGATRLFAYRDFLRNKLSHLNIRTLAYTRLSSFKHPILDFVIAGYVKSGNYFIMPWHTEHRLLDLSKSTILPIYLSLRSLFNLSDISPELGKAIGIFGSMSVGKNYIWISRGSSVIYIRKRKDRTTLRFVFSKYYPPKQCLESESIRNLDTFGKTSLCSLGAAKSDNVCFYCSSFNCNRDILSVLLSQTPRSQIEVKQPTRKRRKSVLVKAVERLLDLRARCSSS